MTHDASAFVGQLRDHLAAHDRPVSFLFGAGTSCCVNTGLAGSSAFSPLIPAIAGMTSACKNAVEACGAKQKSAWAKLAAECVDLKIPANIESILGRIRTKLDAVTGTDQVTGLDRAGWQALDATVREEIARLVTPNASSIPAAIPHDDFANWIKNTSRRRPTEVFTTNYDVLFERSFDMLRVPHFDGFIGSQHAYYCAEAVEDEDFLPPPSWVRYWKIHGSVSWTLEQLGSEQRITRRSPSKTGEMILPSHRKYDESRKEPYRSLMDRLTTVLGHQDSLLVACGYSFSDQHINSIIFDALEQHPRTHLVALMFGSIDENLPLAKRAANMSNILVAGRNAAVISRRFGSWSVNGKPDAQTTEATFGLVRADPQDADFPHVHAGDFVSLGGFLRRIHGGR